MLNFDVGFTSFDQCRKLIYEGISLGMLVRLHRHVIVNSSDTKSDLLKKIKDSGLTCCDELCLHLEMTERMLLE